MSSYPSQQAKSPGGTVVRTARSSVMSRMTEDVVEPSYAPALSASEPTAAVAVASASVTTTGPTTRARPTARTETTSAAAAPYSSSPSSIHKTAYPSAGTTTTRTSAPASGTVSTQMMVEPTSMDEPSEPITLQPTTSRKPRRPFLLWHDKKRKHPTIPSRSSPRSWSRLQKEKVTTSLSFRTLDYNG